MIGVIVSFIIGSIFGCAITCCLVVAGDEDRKMEGEL